MTQRTYGHLQQLGGTRLIAARIPQSRHNIGFFEVVEMIAEVNSRFGQVKFSVDTLGIVIRYVVRQLFGLDLIGTLESYCSLNGVLQLPHVAMPGIIFQDLDRLW